MWRKSARTPGRFGGGGKRRGSAGLQPTKIFTMTVPAVIERGSGTGVSDTPPPPPRAQNAPRVSKRPNAFTVVSTDGARRSK